MDVHEPLQAGPGSPHLSLLLPVIQELLEVPVAVLLLQASQAQRGRLQDPEQAQGGPLIQSQVHVC